VVKLDSKSVEGEISTPEMEIPQDGTEIKDEQE